jgi:hypothetical protein
MASISDFDSMRGKVHCRLVFKGKTWDIKVFNLFIQAMDPEYPGVCRPDQLNLCPKCHGIVWKDPLIAPTELIKLADQLNIKLTVKSFIPEETCNGAN